MIDFFTRHNISADFVHTLKKCDILTLAFLQNWIIRQRVKVNDSVDIITPLQRDVWVQLVTNNTSTHDRQEAENFIRSDRVLALVVE
jgi:hypothetical protein